MELYGLMLTCPGSRPNVMFVLIKAYLGRFSRYPNIPLVVFEFYYV